jgi:hypothetical protein
MARFQACIYGKDNIDRGIHLAPSLYTRFLKAWLIDEKARFIGGKGSRGKIFAGYRSALAHKKLSGREGTWSTRITHLFKGYVDGETIATLTMRAGAGLNHPNRLTEGMKLMHTGGRTTTNSFMPVPIYENLKRIGFNGPWQQGSLYSGMRSTVYSHFGRTQKRLEVIEKNGKLYYFDKTQRLPNGKFPRDALLMIGVSSVTIPRVLKGNLDFYSRWQKQTPAIINRGRAVVNRASASVFEKGNLD